MSQLTRKRAPASVSSESRDERCYPGLREDRHLPTNASPPFAMHHRPGVRRATSSAALVLGLPGPFRTAVTPGLYRSRPWRCRLRSILHPPSSIPLGFLALHCFDNEASIREIARSPRRSGKRDNAAAARKIFPGGGALLRNSAQFLTPLNQRNCDEVDAEDAMMSCTPSPSRSAVIRDPPANWNSTTDWNAPESATGPAKFRLPRFS
jgi:hypothetical protein